MKESVILLREALKELEAHNRDYHHMTPEAFLEEIRVCLVDMWHAQDVSDCSLHEYLGMSWEDYSIWVQGKRSLYGFRGEFVK